MDEQQPRSGRRRTREEADRLAAECVASGLSQREFCEQRGVPLKTLVRYLARYRREQSGENQMPRWVAVEVAAKCGDSAQLSIILAAVAGLRSGGASMTKPYDGW